MEIALKKALDPLNIRLVDYPKFIKGHLCEEVTSNFIHDPTGGFHPQGLFSEQIFGPVGSEERFKRFGYIKLNCRIFHPVIFQNLLSLKRYYGEIISGRSYAVWDPQLRDFMRPESPDDPEADTGFSFFLQHYSEINLLKNKSLKRNDKINVLRKYADVTFTDTFLVIPAGIRDMEEDEGIIQKDTINSLYSTLLVSCKAMPKNGDTDPLYDVIHYSIQKKVMDIYEYLMNMVQGKRGYLQGKLGHRSVIGGTRNVITATNLEASDPAHPQYHRCDETKVPLFQAAKGYSSLVLYQLRSLFYSNIVSQSVENVSLIDPLSLHLVYVTIDPKDKDMLVTDEGIQKMIDRFRDPEFRTKPVIAKSGGNPYYLYLVYDDNSRIYLFRNLEEFKADFGDKFDPKKVRPLTYAELLYIATYFAANGKNGTVTRYPITGPESIYVSRTHVITTAPARVVKLMANAEDDTGRQLPEYPILSNKFLDAVMFHPSKRAGLNADYDGNCVTGDTVVQIRFKQDWVDLIKTLDYSKSDQNIQTAVGGILKDSVTLDGYIYSRTPISNIPQPGEFKYDRNQAKVYDIPVGCEVLSINDAKSTWMPFEKITVEDNCEYVTIKVRSRNVNVSTNPSVAVFNHLTGELQKVAPDVSVGQYAPILRKDPVQFGTYGTFEDGWLLGVMVSDGYVTEKYLGYTKIEDTLRTHVIDVLKARIGDDLYYKEYAEDPNEGANKLARSVSLHITDKRAIQFGRELDMYAGTPWNALTKRIPTNVLLNGSKEYLLGILCGLFDGDGMIYLENNGRVGFRFSTSSKELVNSIKFLGYRLGISVSHATMAARGWSKESYAALFRTNDMFRYIDQLRFYSERNMRLLETFRSDRANYGYGINDSIPLTLDEAKQVARLQEQFNPNTPIARCKVTCRRKVLLPLTRYMDPDSQLYKRIVNTDVEWQPITVVSTPEKATVYDLLVPGSKVFAVNNGLIIYDTVSWIPIFSDEANKECEEYNNSLAGFIDPDGSTQVGTDDLIGLTLHAMTMDCKELHS